MTRRDEIITNRLKKVTEKVEQITIDIAGGGVAGEHVQVIQGLAARLGVAAGLLIEATQSIEVKEKFGGEESYWTLYRLLCIEGKRGFSVSLRDIWIHLEKNYDLSLETLDTLEATLYEWAGDLETDVLERNGVQGQFMQSVDRSGFVFVEYAEPKKKAELAKSVPSGTPATVDIDDKSTEVGRALIAGELAEEIDGTQSLLQQPKDVIVSILQGSDKPIKQADLRRRLQGELGVDEATSLGVLRELSEAGVIFRCKPQGLSAYYAISQEIADDFMKRGGISSRAGSKKETDAPNPAVTARILDAIIKPRTYVEQTYSADEIAAETGLDVSVVKRVLGKLCEGGLVQRVKASKTNRGHRSRSHEELRFRVADQETKMLLVQVRGRRELEGFMRTYLEV